MREHSKRDALKPAGCVCAEERRLNDRPKLRELAIANAVKESCFRSVALDFQFDGTRVVREFLCHQMGLKRAVGGLTLLERNVYQPAGRDLHLDRIEVAFILKSG